MQKLMMVIILAILLVLLLVGLSEYKAQADCKAAQLETGRPTRMTEHGCAIEVIDGRWYPLDLYRWVNGQS